MMMTRFQLAFGVVLAFARFASGQESLDDMPLEQLVDHFVSTFDRNMEEGHAAQFLGASERRLADAKGGADATKDTKKPVKVVGEIPSVSYATICTGNCWNALKTEFTESLKVMDSPACKTKKNKEKVEKVQKGKTDAKNKIDDAKKAKGGDKGGDKAGDKAGTTGSTGGSKPTGTTGGKAGDKKPGDKAGGKRLLAAAKADKKKPDKQESDCIFDLCAKSQIVEMCNGTAGGNVSGNATNMTGGMDKYDMDDCQKASANFICKSVCSASCKDSADMRTLLCGKSGSDTGKFSSESGGGGLKKMFNGICSKNAGGDYCYDLIKADLTANKFNTSADKAKEGKMPDPCKANCSSPLGVAVTALGCCFPAFMDVQKKYKVIKTEAARFAKVTAAKCAKQTAFAACTGGQLTKTKSKQFKLNTTGSCDNLGTEAAEDAFSTSMSDQLNLTAGDVEVLTCVQKGATCATRRLGAERHLSTASEVDVNVQVSGDDADAQMSTLIAQMDSGLASTLTATAEQMAEGETADATTDTTAATSATTGAAMVSSALVRRLSSFALAVVLGSAWLRQ